MYTGLEGFRKYISIYQAPFDDTDIGIIDSLLEGNIYIDDEGKMHLTEFAEAGDTAN